jgi:acyl-CoA synthetase (AMP-forming)/AMP-acid ligase II
VLTAQLDTTAMVLRGWDLRPGERVVGQVSDGPDAAIACLVVSGVCAHAPLAPGLTEAEVAAALDALNRTTVPVAEDLDTRDRSAVPDRKPDEVVIRGPGVMAGYLDDPHANAAAFVDGWLRTMSSRRMSLTNPASIATKKTVAPARLGTLTGPDAAFRSAGVRGDKGLAWAGHGH